MPDCSQSTDASCFARKHLVQAALLFLLPCLFYFPVYRAGLIWDDAIMLTENPLIKTPGGLLKIWFSTKSPDYFPLTLTTFWFEWRLWGEWLGGYHLTNVLLHATGAVLFWRVLLRLRIPAAWLCAAVFVLHPVCVASVAWIAERKNTLSLVFYLLTVLYYFRWRDEKAGRSYWAALSFFLLALLSKTSVVMLPFLLLLCDWWRDHPSSLKPLALERHPAAASNAFRCFLWPLVPFFLLSLFLGLVTVWFQAHRAMGVDVSAVQDPLGTRLLAGTWATWFYLWKTLLPLGLSMIYPRWQIDPHSVISYLGLLAWIVLFLVLWTRRRRWGRVWLAGLGCFLLTLLPVIGFFRMFFFIYAQAADHWQYLALLASIPLFVGSVLWSLRRVSRVVVWGHALLVLLLLGVLTWRQASAYQTAEMLWSDTLRKNPAAWMAHNNLGIELENRGEIEGSLFHFHEALRLRPGNADALYNLGKSFDLRGDKDEAEKYYRQVLASEPDYIKAHNNLAMILEGQGKLADAEQHYRHALRARPDYVVAHNNLSQLLLKQGHVNEAMAHAQEAVRLSPEFAQAHYNLANALSQQGKNTEAMTEYRAALLLQPNYVQAHYNLGNVLARLGRLPQAREEYQQALKIDPDFAGAHANLGQVWQLEGNLAAASNALARAIELNPRDAVALNQFGLLLAREDRPAEALHYLSAALALDPSLPEAHFQLGNILLQQGKKSEAWQQYLAVATPNPAIAQAHYGLAMTALSSRHEAEAITHLQEAIRLKSDWREAMNNLAWLLSTSPQPELRDGKLALNLALTALRLPGTNDFEVLDTLAAAYAETRQFNDAVASAEKAARLARETAAANLSAEIQNRLHLYQSKKPFRSDLTLKQ